MKKFLALLLTLTMAFGMMSFSASAESLYYLLGKPAAVSGEEGGEEGGGDVGGEGDAPDESFKPFGRIQRQALQEAFPVREGHYGGGDKDPKGEEGEKKKWSGGLP